jgi:hypothetical protein
MITSGGHAMVDQAIAAKTSGHRTLMEASTTICRFPEVIKSKTLRLHSVMCWLAAMYRIPSVHPFASVTRERLDRARAYRFRESGAGAKLGGVMIPF